REPDGSGTLVSLVEHQVPSIVLISSPAGLRYRSRGIGGSDAKSGFWLPSLSRKGSKTSRSGGLRFKWAVPGA
ncbi:MAG TPA: hypothetical protein VEX38_09030, partial [Fimbriimonadaceae bacterium]|nr:hypothetical protein [Fimbriimonadaceae bacterium]